MSNRLKGFFLIAVLGFLSISVRAFAGNLDHMMREVNRSVERVRDARDTAERVYDSYTEARKDAIDAQTKFDLKNQAHTAAEATASSRGSDVVPARGPRPRAGGGDAKRSRPLTSGQAEHSAAADAARRANQAADDSNQMREHAVGSRERFEEIKNSEQQRLDNASQELTEAQLETQQAISSLDKEITRLNVALARERAKPKSRDGAAPRRRPKGLLRRHLPLRFAQVRSPVGNVLQLLSPARRAGHQLLWDDTAKRTIGELEKKLRLLENQKFQNQNELHKIQRAEERVTEVRIELTQIDVEHHGRGFSDPLPSDIKPTCQCKIEGNQETGLRKSSGVYLLQNSDGQLIGTIQKGSLGMLGSTPAAALDRGPQSRDVNLDEPKPELRVSDAEYVE